MKKLRHLCSFVFLFGLLTLLGSCKTHSYVADIDTSYLQINRYKGVDSSIVAMIAPYKARLDGKMNEVIAHTDTTLYKDRPNSLLGSWFCNILLEEARSRYGKNVDFALQNYGGLRIGNIPKGDITVGKIYELMPFDNKLVLLDLTGREIEKLAQTIIDKGGWPLSQNIVIYTKDNRVAKIMIASHDLKHDQIYTIALPDYVANGGDNIEFLATAPRMDKDILLRQAVIDHLKAHVGKEKNIHIDTTKKIIQE